MGGGDLNTKKSWHPNTMKNQEKVWKAEQAEANERKRIDDLRREINNERSREELTLHGQSSGVLAENRSKKMDWMYKQPHESVDREQYLLGKKIDKTFEKIVSEDKGQSYIKAPPKNHVEHECIPFSIRNLSSDVDPNECQVDMARKLMEDPLVAIKKRELESRSQLLQNPVKLKELTMLLKMDQAKKKSKKEKKSKKHKKGSSDIDKKLAEKLLKLKGIKDINNILTSPKSSVKKSSKKKKKRSHSVESNSSDEPRNKSKHDVHRYKNDDSDFSDEPRSKSKHESRKHKYDSDSSDEPRSKSKREEHKRKYDDSDTSDEPKSKSKREFHQRKDYYSNASNEPRSKSNHEGHKRTNDEVISKSKREGYKCKNYDSDSSDEPKNKSKHERQKGNKDSSKDQSRDRHDSSDKGTLNKRYQEYNNDRDRYRSKLKDEHKQRESPERNYSKNKSPKTYDSDDSQTTKKKKYGLLRADGSKIHQSKKHEAIPFKSKSEKIVQKYEKPKRVHLSEAEKEQRRMEMMENAVKRDKEREKNVSYYKEQDKKQEVRDKHSNHKPDFVEKHLRDTAKYSSVESRIKSNIYNIQRSSKHMDSNFAKR